MTQNNEPKTKPEDAVEPTKPETDQEEIEFLDSMALMDLEGMQKLMKLMDALDEGKPAPPDLGDMEEPDPFATINLTEALPEPTAPQPQPGPAEIEVAAIESAPVEAEVPEAEIPEAEVPEAEDEEHEETAFFDASDLLAELDGVEPSEPKPDLEDTAPPPPEPDPVEAEAPEAQEAAHEEAAFFDSSTLIQELHEAEAEQIEPGHDETVFLYSGPAPAAKPAAAKSAEEPAAPLEIKKIGNYEIVQMLGKGGFGSVWSAKASDGHPVAIKVLNPDILENERAVRKFFHEAINLAKMNHPNICSFIDFFPHEGNYAIVMDFVQGRDLQDLLESQGGPLPFKLARQVASQALDGFHYALQQQVLHRDIKPENITLTAEGAAKIMDFGIARLSSTESQQTSLYMISPAYTAPERFDVHKADLVDHRSDIYSLGLVFYEIFTGKHPFLSTNPTEMIVAHMSKVPPPPNEIVEGIPDEISNAILKALEKDPEKRFQDFAEFKIEMLGEPPLISSQSIGPMEFFGETCKNSATMLKNISGLIKKHQKQAKKITVGQVGNKINLIIETFGGNELRITRDIE